MFKCLPLSDFTKRLSKGRDKAGFAGSEHRIDKLSNDIILALITIWNLTPLKDNNENVKLKEY